MSERQSLVKFEGTCVWDIARERHLGLIKLVDVCLVTQLCLTLWYPMDCSILGAPVLCYLLEFAPVHLQWVGDAI